MYYRSVRLFETKMLFPFHTLFFVTIVTEMFANKKRVIFARRVFARTFYSKMAICMANMHIYTV